MSLQDIVVSDYDVVASVTEASINTALYFWLYQQPTAIQLYCVASMDGGYDPVSTQSAATTTLNGTLVPTQNVVTLVSLGGSQSIEYAVTIQDGNFQDQPGINVSTGTDPWVLHFVLDLKSQSVTQDQLPANLQSAVTGLNASEFSYQQLYGDVSSATLIAVDNMPGLSPGSQAFFALQGIMRTYLNNLAQTGITLGYTATTTSPDPSSPTLIPSAFDFCVSKYVASETPAPVGLDTLNYLIMTNGRPLPASTPNGFDFNWVEDPTQAGTIAVRQGLIAGALGDLLNPVFALMSQAVSADAHGDHDDGEIRVGPGTLNAFALNSSPGPTRLVVNYDYASSDHDSHLLVDVAAQYQASCQLGFGVTNSESGVVDWTSAFLVGDYSYSGHITNQHKIVVATESTLPETTYRWYANLQMQAGKTGLNFQVSDSDFNSAPYVASESESTFQEILNALSGEMKKYVNDLSGINQNLESTVTQQLAQTLAAATSVTAFVFPLNQTFVFAQPQFTESCDLVAAITYQAN